MYFTRKDFDIKKVIALSKNYILASLIMFVFCMITGHFINNNVMSIIAQMLVGMVSYFLVLAILKDEIF